MSLDEIAARRLELVSAFIERQAKKRYPLEALEVTRRQDPDSGAYCWTIRRPSGPPLLVAVEEAAVTHLRLVDLQVGLDAEDFLAAAEREAEGPGEGDEGGGGGRGVIFTLEGLLTAWPADRPTG